MDNHSKVFETPKGLPLIRDHDHAIHLIEPHFTHCPISPIVLSLWRIFGIETKNNQILISHFQQAKHTPCMDIMETDTKTSYDRDSDSTTKLHAPRRPRKGGKHVREEPTSLTQLKACPLSMACFREQSCYQYCEMIARIQHHQELARLFVLHLHDGQVTLTGVNFTLTPETISQETGILKDRKSVV